MKEKYGVKNGNGSGEKWRRQRKWRISGENQWLAIMANSSKNSGGIESVTGEASQNEIMAAKAISAKRRNNKRAAAAARTQRRTLPRIRGGVKGTRP
jgi:hypothetical protein